MTKLNQLAELGQAVWLDFIRRSFVTSGDLQALIDDGLRGITSNPSIFEKAIAGSDDYDADLRRLVDAGKSAVEIYEALALDDIGRAADLLRPVYDATAGLDGYVSLEVSPELAHDAHGTIVEARRLFAALSRPNVMIKVPATPAGMPAVETLIGEGINVNVTLIFSLAHYEAAAEAYIAGLERWVTAGGDPSRVASVASFFVSRVDTAVDKALEDAALRGKAAVANAKVAYARFRDLLSTPRWQALAAQGARPQRVLWASTSTKNPAYSDVLYVDPLIGPDTVNTLPPNTLDAFRDHGVAAVTVDQGLDDARAHLERLAVLGIDMDTVTETLQVEGLDAFARAFRTMMDAVVQKRARLLRASANLGRYQAAVDAALVEMERERVLARIWEHDHTVWHPEPANIANRLGWLHSPSAMGPEVPRMESLAAALHAEGYTHALLLGMGGSSLAPEVFRKTFGVAEGGLDLAVLDSTDPAAVLAHAERLDLARTLFVVSTKSGVTVETFSFFKFFYNRAADALGAEEAGRHFVAITDPGSQLAEIAARLGFRAVFLNDPNIGGRYSALSFFGLLPAALIGADVRLLLDRAQAAEDVRAAWLGAALSELAQVGRDKVTFALSPGIASFGDWLEQLIAESTGKSGRGILPVVGELLGPPEVYGSDRFFVYLRVEGDATYDAALAALAAAGHPVVRFTLQDCYDLGEQMFLWGLATAVAGHRLGIHPFDQPNVESAKVQARRMVDAYKAQGALPEVEPAPLTGAALAAFVAQAGPGDYVALQAYIPPTEATDAALQALRLWLRDRYRLATTVGYGPRFLHSTSQLHKGDGGNGLFVQLTASHPRDVPIPDEAGAPESSITFGVQVDAQALGDRQALLDAHRRVIRFDLGADVVAGLEALRTS
ncbi:MAG: bifunctional transaldolase/phosoglucose isomerase [Anaerolineae bacterium]|nr:bifunctional transaldolase/phosoglucose isomerase [Anaerolineae bacterium]